MKKIEKLIPIELIELNNGQIPGVPKNPRKYTKKDVEVLAESMRETPEMMIVRAPLVVLHNDKYVALGGNRRVEAARMNGEKKVLCIIMEGLSTRKKKEIAFKDNVSAGQWDTEKLQAEWQDMPLQKWKIEGIKWDNAAKEVKEDDFDEDRMVKVRCKKGDVWELGDHRLMCGDSVDLEQVKTLMGGGNC